MTGQPRPPLWREMALCRGYSHSVPILTASEILAVISRLPTMPPRELIERWANEPNASMQSMTIRTMEWICATLLDEARKAETGA